MPRSWPQERPPYVPVHGSQDLRGRHVREELEEGRDRTDLRRYRETCGNRLKDGFSMMRGSEW